MGKFADFFGHNSPEEVTRAGYNPSDDVSSEVEKLHQSLAEMGVQKDEPVMESVNPPPENMESLKKREQMQVVAKNVIDSFGFDPNSETMMVITDTGVIEAQPELIAAIQADLETRTSQPKAKGNFRIRVLSETTRSAQDMGDYVLGEMESLRGSPILIITSMSRSHSKETGAAIRGLADREILDTALKTAKGHGHLMALEDQLTDEQYEKLRQFARKNACRLISITKGKNPHDILTKGAVEAPVAEILERDNRINELMKDVEKVHITSAQGTDLWLSLIEETKGYESEDFSKPGSLGNYPIGEWACSLDWKGSNGILVVDGPIGGEHMLDQVKANGPLKLTIREGEIIEINGQSIDQDSGNPLAESVKAYLNGGNNAKNDAYRLAELGVGSNPFACEGKDDKDIGSSEGEKIYATIHIAFGSNGSLGVSKKHPSYNSAKVHCDMILMNDISVECHRKDGSQFFLIKNGKPQGY
ncbi:MAG: hypothetical protein WC508_04005 [Patescibacteria group bacterium]